MKKKMVAALLCMSMVLGLAGCGGSEAQESGTSEGTGAQESGTVVATDDSAEGATESTGGSREVVTLLSWYTEEQMMPLKEGFESANQDLELEVQYVPPTEQYIQKLTLLMNGNEPTDLFFMCPEVKEDVVATDFAEDLSQLPVMDKLSGSAKRTLGVGDQVYGLSLDSWASFVFYNKEIFEQAGITQIPTTWDELVADMAKIKELGIDPMTAQAEDAGRLLLGLFASNEASKDPAVEAKLADGSAKFSELYKESMDAWYTDVIEPGYLGQSCLSLTNDQQIEMFVNGKAAMMIGGPWSLPDFAAKNPDLQFGTFGIPGFNGEVMLQGAANVGIGITKQAKNKEGAERFMEYLSSDEGVKCWSDIFGNFMNVEGVEYTVDPSLEAFKADVAAGKVYWQTVEWPSSSSVLNVYTSSCQSVIAGSFTPDEALAAVDEKFEEILANQ